MKNFSIVFSEFRQKFFEGLDKKTAWGKEEVKKLFLATALLVVLNEFDEPTDKKTI
jgi:hypothetical protein